METVENIEGLTKSKLIEITKEHINKNKELKKKLDTCLETDSAKLLQRNDKSLYHMLSNIITGAIKPVRCIYTDDEDKTQWEKQTMQHIFWRFRNILMEEDEFSQAWADAGFRRAIMTINIAIERLPGHVDFKDNEDDFDYYNIAAYLLEDDIHTHNGFIMLNSMIDKVHELNEEKKRWDIEDRDMDLLRLSLKIIIECQKIWLASRGV
jgi:hypothetical protein